MGADLFELLALKDVAQITMFTCQIDKSHKMRNRPFDTVFYWRAKTTKTTKNPF